MDISERFLAWMKTQGMSATTCTNYVWGMEKLVKKYAAQAREACSGLCTCEEALFRFASIIQATTDYPMWNRDGHQCVLSFDK